MNILLGVYAVVSIVFVVTRLKTVSKLTITEKKSIDITAESMLLFLAVFELIRLSLN